MQKDVHFYMTYALAIGAGLPVIRAERIAWADQFVDDLTDPKPYGIQTQCAVVGSDWADAQKQGTVLVPFHYVPGDESGNKRWMVTANSKRIRAIIEKALESGHDLQLGIALHVLQDSYSHQGFSGWECESNAVWPWYYLRAAIPNIGHAELGPLPDIADEVWTDPRTGKHIVNPTRVRLAAIATNDVLPVESNSDRYLDLFGKVNAALAAGSYGERKAAFCRMAGLDAEYRYSSITKRMRRDYGRSFATAVRRHLGTVMNLL